MKHTPGPWILGDENNHSAEIDIGGTTASFGREERYNGKYIISREEMLANVHLAMEAPALLKALMDSNELLTSKLSDFSPDHPSKREFIRMIEANEKIIKKATE